MTFQLDPQLETDTHFLGRLCGLRLLLMDNRKVPWFIVVPETDRHELYELSSDDQRAVAEAVKHLSVFIREELKWAKLNVAAIGNVVPQLHIHVVGRQKGDFCWPRPVWGAPGGEPYPKGEVDALAEKVAEFLPGRFHGV
ncbi:MAG: HIT family protein [Desulfobacterales bacterium]|nr:HIT family protein [Desulfobacterales bacterium]